MASQTTGSYPHDMLRAAHREGDPGTLEATAHDLLASWERYVRENPGQATLWALGVGFILGWKLKFF